MTKKKNQKINKKDTALPKSFQYYFHSFLIVLFAAVALVLIPVLTNKTESSFLISSKVSVPTQGSKVAGTFKYNLPPASSNIAPPETSARAILVKDLGTGTVLFEKNSSLKLPNASTTKIMTAVVGSEYFQQNSTLVVGDSAFTAGSSVGLTKGEQLTFRSLLYGMLLNSGNDAAFAIAENYPGGVPGFVEAMNKKVLDLKLPDTHFDNPAGFDSPNHYSSAADLGLITEEALKNPNLVRIFSTKETEVTSLDKRFKHSLVNLNRLLTDVPGVIGVKTGYTENAKENLVSLTDRNEHEILIVVLGSDDRFGESTQLIEWAYKNFTWQ